MGFYGILTASHCFTGISSIFKPCKRGKWLQISSCMLATRSPNVLIGQLCVMLLALDFLDCIKLFHFLYPSIKGPQSRWFHRLGVGVIAAPRWVQDFGWRLAQWPRTDSPTPRSANHQAAVAQHLAIRVAEAMTAHDRPWQPMTTLSHVGVTRLVPQPPQTTTKSYSS